MVAKESDGICRQKQRDMSRCWSPTRGWKVPDSKRISLEANESDSTSVWRRALLAKVPGWKLRIVVKEKLATSSEAGRKSVCVGWRWSLKLNYNF